jgi:hypothetical protein
MKLPPLPMVVLPSAGVQPAHQGPHGAATAAQEAQALAAAQAQQAQGHRRGHSFKAVHGHRTHAARGRPPAPRALQPRRRQAAGALSSQAALDDDHDFAQEDLDEQRRLRDLQSLTVETRHGDQQHKDDHHHEGQRQERRFAAVAFNAVRTRLRPEPSADAGLPSTLEDIAAALLRLSNGARRPASESPEPSAALAALAVARRRAASGDGTSRADRPDLSDDPETTLASIRAALVASGVPPVPPDAAGESVRIWLPVFLLHLHKPRRPGQHRQPGQVETLALLQRGFGRIAQDRDGR